MSEYPSDWTTTQLQEAATDFIVPMRDRPKEFKGSIPWIRIEDFKGKWVSCSQSGLCVNEEIIKEMNLKVHPQGTVLCSCSANLGVCAITERPLITNQTFIGIVPDPAKIDTEYLYYLVRSKASQLQTLSSGTTIAYLPRKKFEEFEVCIPPLPEQKKIAEILSGIDITIATLEKNRSIQLQAIEKTANNYIDTRMQGCLGIEDMYYRVIDGDRGAEYPKNDDFAPRGHCLFLSAKNVTKGGFDFDHCQFITKEKDEAMRKGRLSTGDLVITTRGTLGNVAHFEKVLPANSIRINSGMAVIRAECGRDIEVERFILFCLQSEFLQSQITKASFGTAQNQLTLGIIKKLQFPLFTQKDQNSFVALCEVTAKYKVLSRENIHKHYQLKKAISNDLLSGRKRVSI